uniref:Uncharacterized protein n=1 Tax=Anguilla anguilla TaxID=7936 RepID=A0A0E9P6P0_ANGAN
MCEKVFTGSVIIIRDMHISVCLPKHFLAHFFIVLQ